MRAGVVDSHAQVAAASVEVEGARLEHRQLRRIVEVGERDEVAQQGVQVAVVVDEAHGVGDGLGLGLALEILGDECLEAWPQAVGEQRSHALDAELLDRGATLLRLPRLERREPGRELRPLRGGE